jgi:hypothetical protein
MFPHEWETRANTADTALLQAAATIMAGALANSCTDLSGPEPLVCDFAVNVRFCVFLAKSLKSELENK